MALARMETKLHVSSRRIADTGRSEMSRMIVQCVLHLFEDAVEVVQLSFGPKIRQRRKDMGRCSVAGHLRASIMVQQGQ